MWSLAGSRTTRAGTTSSACSSGRAPPTTTASWSSPTFDAAIAEAGSATDPAVASAAFDRAEGIVRDEVPVVPLAYGAGLGAVADRAARGRPERSRHRAHGGPGVGGLMRPPAARRCSSRPGSCSASRRSPARRRRHGPTSATPTADVVVQDRGRRSASRSRSRSAAGRVELLLTSADAIGPTVIVVPNPPAAGSATLTYRLDPADGHILAEHADGRPLAADRRRRSDRCPARTRGHGSPTPTTGSTWKTQTGGIVPRPLVRGLGRVRQARPQDRRGRHRRRRPRCSA